MRLFGGERFRAMMARFGMDSGEALQHSLLSGSIERAQKRVEERNYEIRKHLLEYDDVLNKQRHYFYEVRDSIMQESDMAGRVINTGTGLAQEIFDAYEQDQKHMSQRHEADATLLQRLQEQLAFAPAERASFLALRADAMLVEVKTYMDSNLQEKAEIMTAEQLNQFLRYEYINLLDDQWQEHLEQMEALRDAVGLRHYAQKNPLVEYKLEGFKIFDRMIDAIPVTLVKKIMHIRIALAQPNKAIPHAPAKIVAQHQSLSDTMSGVDKKGTQTRAKVAQADHVQVRRTEPKLGRNEPCPCGSGKKYKHCHGKD
jgi:preprotein translocase subunit SecA